MPTVLPEALPRFLLAIWLTGAIATGWAAWRRWTRFRRLLSHASPAPSEWQSLASRLSAELSLRCPPQILAAPGRLPPLVVPTQPRPLMLLPWDLMGQLSASQRESLLRHELMHIKRGDHLVRMLELTVAVVYWWLPVVGAIGRQLRTCEEACCDAAVVAHMPQARRDYAQLLLDVLDFANSLPRQAVPQATTMSAAQGLEQRLLAILDAPARTGRRWPGGLLAAGLACAILPCELQYHFPGRTTPAASPADPDPSAGADPSGSGDRSLKALGGCSCPT